MKQCLKPIFIILFTVFLASCTTLRTTEAEAFNSKVEKLEKGMTKKEVINILGGNYVTIREGSYDAVLKKSVEIIRYPRKHPEKSYSIRFANGKLYDISRI